MNEMKIFRLSDDHGPYVLENGRWTQPDDRDPSIKEGDLVIALPDRLPRAPSQIVCLDARLRIVSLTTPLNEEEP